VFDIQLSEQLDTIDHHADGTCYTCAGSPPWRGPGTPAGCAMLTGYEDMDEEVVTYCENSGCNDRGSDRPGWPLRCWVRCGKWEAR